MTLQQLRYFCVMAEVLHYTKAASQLYISQPSLSYALSELEKELGLPLFEKKGKKTFLTKYGEAFLPYAKNALNELSKGEALLLEMSQSATGTIDLGYIYSVGFDILPCLVEQFYSSRSDRGITFNFHQNMTRNLMDNLRQGSLDLVLAARTDGDDLESVVVGRQNLFLVVSNKHPLASRTQADLDDIKDEPFIAINSHTAISRQVEEYFAQAGKRLNTVFEVDDCNSVAAFVSSQMGVTIMPRIPSLDSYNVVAIPIHNTLLEREICLFWDKNRKMIPAVREFRDYVIETFGNQDPVREF